MGDRIDVVLQRYGDDDLHINNPFGMGVGFTSPDHFAAWLSNEVLRDEQVFIGGIGSDNHTPVSTSGPTEITLGMVIHHLKRVGQVQANAIRDMFEERANIALIAPIGQEAVFHYTIQHQHRNRLGGMQAGNEPVRFLSPYGVTKRVHDFLKVPPKEIIDTLYSDTSPYPVFTFEGEPMQVDTPEGYCSYVRSLACGQLCFFLRFVVSKRSDMIRVLVGSKHKNRYEKTQPSQIKQKNDNGTLMNIFLKTVAESEGVPFTKNVCSIPMSEKSIRAVCDKFQLFGVISDVSAQVALLEIMESDGMYPSGYIKKAKFDNRRKQDDSFRRGSLRMFCSNNCPERHARSVRTINNLFVMIGVNTNNNIAHLEPVLDGRIEKSTAYSAINRVVNTVEVPDQPEEGEEGIRIRLEAKDMIPPTVVDRPVPILMPMLQKCAFSRQNDQIDLESYDEIEEFVKLFAGQCDELSGLCHKYDIDSDGMNIDDDKDELIILGDAFKASIPLYIGADICIDSDAMKDYALHNKLEHMNVSGLAQLYDSIHRSISDYRQSDGRSLSEYVHMNEFNSVLNAVQARKLYVSDAKTMVETEYNDSSVGIVRSHDISSFAVHTRDVLDPILTSNGTISFNKLATVTTVDIKAKDLSYRLAPALLASEIKGVTTQVVVDREICKRAKLDEPMTSADIASLTENVKNGLELINEYQEQFARVNWTAVANKYATKGVHKLIMERNSKDNAKKRIHFGSFHHPEHAMLYVTDRQIDEPVIPVQLDCNRPGGIPSRRLMETDLNKAYTAVYVGLWDWVFVRLPDFTGHVWHKDSEKLPSQQNISYIGNDYLFSYKGDWGYVVMGNVDWQKIHRFCPEVYNIVCPFFRYRTGTPNGVGDRKVLVNLVIATCIETLRVKTAERGHAYSKSERRELFIYLQRDCMRIRYGVFNLTSVQRAAVHSSPQAAPHKWIHANLKYVKIPGLAKFESTHLSGILPTTDKVRKELIKEYIDADIEFFRLCRMTGMSEDDAYKFGKLDENSGIGALKGPVPGCIKLTTTPGLAKYEHVLRYGGNRTVTPTATQQIHVCELPIREEGEEIRLLVQNVDASPVFTQRTGRCDRIDTMAKESFVMLKLASICNAVIVKTDAVYYSVLDDEGNYNTDKIVDWVEGGQGPNHGQYLRGGDVLEDKKRCNDAYCLKYTGCEHSRGRIASHNYNGLEYIPLVKTIYHPGTDDLKDGADLEDLEFNNRVNKGSIKMQRNAERECISESDREISKDGIRMLKCLGGTKQNGKSICTSSFLPDIYKDGCTGILKRERVDEPVSVLDPENPGMLSEHYILYNGGSVVTESHVYWFDPDGGSKKYYDEYEIAVVAETILMGRVLYDGVPGTGKSTIQKRLITELSRQLTNVFVSTTTHGTLSQFLPMESENIHVCTFSSLIGVYKGAPVAALDPWRWFNGKSDGTDPSIATYGKFKKYCTSGTAMTILVDECEMLKDSAESILLYLSKLANIILVGDRKQTAAIGKGIRYNGSAMDSITGGNTITFDVQFRRADASIVALQDRASTVNPLLYLDPRITIYESLDGLDAPELVDMYNLAASEYLKAAGEQVVYASTGICAPSHKLSLVITGKIIETIEKIGLNREKTYDSRYMYIFTGPDACDKEGFANTDDEGHDGNLLEDTRTSIDHHKRDTEYVKKFYHHPCNSPCKLLFDWYRTPFVANINWDKYKNGNPKESGFYVGTKVYLVPHQTYKTMYRFKPSVFESTPSADSDVKKGGLLIFETIVNKTCRVVKLRSAMTAEDHEEEERDIEMMKSKGSKKKKDEKWYIRFEPTTIDVYQFYDCVTKEKVCLTREAVRANIFYPFAGYSGVVVGHTYDNFYNVNVFDGGPGCGYTNIKEELTIARDYMGKSAWISPFVRQMNVNTSRVTKGHKTNVFDVKCTGVDFWHKHLSCASWHIASKSQKDQMRWLRECRKSASTAAVLYSTIRNGGFTKASDYLNVWGLQKRKRSDE